MRILAALLLAGALPAGAALAEAGPNGFDLRRATIPVEEIRSGGPPRDGIPSIDAPKFESVPEADAYLRSDDLVLSLVRDDDARAYPVRILDYHEIVNDVVAGTPVLVSYCPLCGSGMVFLREVAGRSLSFGVSGLLYRSDVLMYDRETESLWTQLGQRAVSGELVGRRLELVASRMQRWRAWKREHPEGRVLSRRTGHQRAYGQSPYARYERSPGTMFPVPKHREDLPAKTWVYGVVVDGVAKAYRQGGLTDGSTSDTVAGRRLRLEHDPEGLGLRVLDAENGGEIPHTRAYWFAWQAFHPETELYTGEKP